MQSALQNNESTPSRMPLQILRRNTGASGAPSSLASGQLAWSAVDKILYIGDGDNGSGLGQSVTKIGGAGAFVLATLLGAANGVATLDATGKLPAAQLTAAVVGALNYQGVWNASTNSPALASGAGTKGYMYKVSVTGTTSLDGHSQWNVGDMAVYNGTSWDKLDGLDPEVITVAGRTGNVTLSSADLTDATTIGKTILTATSAAAVRNLIGVDGQTNISDANYTVLAADNVVQLNTATATRTFTLPPANAVNAGREITLGDGGGVLTSAINLVISRAGADTVDGATSLTLASSRAQVVLCSNGSNKWVTICRSYPSTMDDGTF